MDYKIDSRATRHTFESLAQVLAWASPERSGDVLAGIAAPSAQDRVSARWLLSDLPLTVFVEDLLIPYEADEVTRLIIDGHDTDRFAAISHLTVGGFREWLLDERTDGADIASAAGGITPEMAAQGVLFDEACAQLRRDYDAQNGLWTSWGHFDRRIFERQCRNFKVAYPFG